MLFRPYFSVLLWNVTSGGLIVYAEDVNMFGDSVHTTKKDTEILIVASKEIDRS